MEIFIITICNKRENYSNNLVEKYGNLIKKFYKLNYVDITFQTTRAKKNLFLLQPETKYSYELR